MFYGLVLAGGQSSRMGRNKALLDLAGRTLLDRAIDLLRSSGAQKVFVSGQVEAYDCIPDLLPFSGPPGGLYSFLSYLKNNEGLNDAPILIIPVDMPSLNKALLLSLLEGLGDAQSAHFEGEVFPSLFRASLTLYRHLQRIFTDSGSLGGPRSMKGLFHHEHAKVLSKAAFKQELFANINRPAEWQDFLKSL